VTTTGSSEGLRRVAFHREWGHRWRKFVSQRPVRRFLSNRAAVVAGVVIVLFALVSIIGPFVLGSGTRVGLGDRFAPASAEHLLGTDHLGRDLLTRIVEGGRVSLTVAVFATFLGLVPALALGMAAGYFGGFVDDALSRTFEIIQTFPTLLLALVFVQVLGPSLSSLIIAIAIADMPKYARLVRALTLEVRTREYIASATSLGYSAFRIMGRHILPNVYVPVIVIATGSMGNVALAEAALSFLGAGIQPPDPSWGNIVSESQRYLQYYPLLALVPGIALSILTVAFVFFGDGLRDALDVREPSVRAE
jgi:peptide/nickel transport system permease protein